MLQVCDLLADKKLARVSMEEFLDGHTNFEVIVYDNDSEEARADTAKIAMMAMDQKGWIDARYDLLGHNCEHFATFCRTGIKDSKQSKVATGVGGGILGVVALASMSMAAMAGEAEAGSQTAATNDDSD